MLRRFAPSSPSTMTDDVVRNKALSIERCLTRVREEFRSDRHRLEDQTVEDAIVLNLQRACEAAIDLAMHATRSRRSAVALSQGSMIAARVLAPYGVRLTENRILFRCGPGRPATEFTELRSDAETQLVPTNRGEMGSAIPVALIVGRKQGRRLASVHCPQLPPHSEARALQSLSVLHTRNPLPFGRVTPSQKLSTVLAHSPRRPLLPLTSEQTNPSAMQSLGLRGGPAVLSELQVPAPLAAQSASVLHGIVVSPEHSAQWQSRSVAPTLQAAAPVVAVSERATLAVVRFSARDGNCCPTKSPGRQSKLVEPNVGSVALVSHESPLREPPLQVPSLIPSLKTASPSQVGQGRT